MAANDNSWIAETVADFIHSPIWRAPIQTFIEEHCAAFDYDDEENNDDEESLSPGGSSIEEQKQIFSQYQKLVDSLIAGLRHDLDLDEKLLKKACEFPSNIENGSFIDELFEQLYSARDFASFQDMMRRKNLILQLQALVSLQLQWGILKQSQTGDDLILTLLLEATKAPTSHETDERRIEPRELPPPPPQPLPAAKQNDDDDDDDDDDVVVESKSRKVPSPRPRTPPSKEKKREKIVQPVKPVKESYRLPDLRRRDELNADWYRKLREKDSSDEDEEKEAKSTSIPQSIGNVSEDVLRQKLKELTNQTASSVDEKTASAMKSRKDFLDQQRKLLVDKRREEFKDDLDQNTRNARPQSAAHAARKAMSTASSTSTTTNRTDQNDQTAKISDEELAKRRALHDKLKRGVINKQ